jgi:Protein of unknown function (DUF3040)
VTRFGGAPAIAAESANLTPLGRDGNPEVTTRRRRRPPFAGTIAATAMGLAERAHNGLMAPTRRTVRWEDGSRGVANMSNRWRGANGGIVIDDHEREALAHLERGLAQSDPAWAAAFRGQYTVRTVRGAQRLVAVLVGSSVGLFVIGLVIGRTDVLVVACLLLAAIPPCVLVVTKWVRLRRLVGRQFPRVRSS